MDESTLQLVINSAGAIGTWLIGPVFLLTLFGYFRLRTGTSYGFLSRLYALLIGRSEFHNDALTAFWQEHKDVERFNALFNTKAKSLKEIELFVQWIERYELDIRKFTRLNNWFDFKKRKVAKLKAWQLVTPLVLFMLSYLASLPAGTIASRDAALIRLGGEEQWIWIGHSAASRYSITPFTNSSNDWRITKSLCNQSDFDASSVADKVSLKDTSVSAICESFDNAQDAERINSLITKQKVFWPLTIILWFFTLNRLLEAIRRANTNQARPYLLEKLKASRIARSSAPPVRVKDVTHEL